MRNSSRIVPISISILFFIFVFCALGLGYYLLFTQGGCHFALEKIKDRYAQEYQISWESVSGTFVDGLEFKNVQISDMDELPKPNVIKIQDMSFALKRLSLEGIEVRIDNFRAVIDDSDPILISGSLNGDKLDFNVSTYKMSIEDLKHFIQDSQFKKLKGDLFDVDIFVKGTIDSLDVTGKAHVSKIKHELVTLENAPCSFELNIKEKKDDVELHGTVHVQQGEIFGKRTALIHLAQSKIYFSGDPANPRLAIRAISEIEEVNINIALRGDLQQPDISVTSTPPMAQSKLLLMLATNKTWKTTEEHFRKGQLSPDMVKDVIDYFLLGGQLDQVANKLGLKDISITFDADVKGVSVSKEITDNIEASYNIERHVDAQNQEVKTKQKIGGEVAITENFSIEVSTELKDLGAGDQSVQDETTNEEILFKFQKPF